MRMIGYISLLVPLLAIGFMSLTVQAQRFAPGYCPTVAAHENFDKTRFFGNWIEVEKTPSIFDLMMRCLVVDYSDDQDNTVNVVVRGVSLAGLPLTVNGDGLLQDVHRTGFYSIRYGFGVPFQGTLTTIVDTDYDDYAVVYSCTNSLLSGVFHSEYIWVLSRSGKISNPTRQNIYEKLDKLAINRSGLTMSDRSTCPTNSTLVARESENNLGGVSGTQAVVGGAPVTSGSGPVSANAAENVIASQSQPSANLEKAAGAEPTQKSVVVPLLYDLPTSASSSSVGSAKVNKNQPPSPVENKIQLPLSGSSAQSKVPVAGAVVKPVVAVVAQSPSSSVSGQPEKSANVQANKPQQAPQQAPVSATQQQPAAPAVQVQQSSNLLNKIQQKP